MEVAAGVRRLGTRYTNFYLIEEGGKLTLLDTGLPGYWKHLVRELAQMGRRLEDIDAILLTHHHPDHIGQAERVRRVSGASTYAHARDAKIINSPVRPRPPRFLSQGWHPFLFRYLLHSILAGATRHIPVNHVNTFADGDVLDVPGRPRVIHVPGHTAGSCALLLQPRSVLFSADALVTYDGLTGKPGPTLLPDFVNENTRLALGSLSAIEGLEAAVMLPGHGEPWRDGVREAVRLVRQNWQAAAPRSRVPLGDATEARPRVRAAWGTTTGDHPREAGSGNE